MAKFDGILLCTDLDGTLFNSENKVSEKNRQAIEYFMENGGKFTFVTGRMPKGIFETAEILCPNVPSVVFNGSGIYDFKNNNMLWSQYLDDDVIKVVDYVVERTEDVGVAIPSDNQIYFCIENKWVDLYYHITKYEKAIPIPYKDIKEKWKKVLFMTSEENIEIIRNLINNSDFKDKYEFVKSSRFLFEILPKNTSKGRTLKKLAEMLNGEVTKVIAAGDSENDIDMIKYADIGYAVSNAEDAVKQSADRITVSNDEDAIAKIIEEIVKGTV